MNQVHIGELFLKSKAKLYGMETTIMFKSFNQKQSFLHKLISQLMMIKKNVVNIHRNIYRNRIGLKIDKFIQY